MLNDIEVLIKHKPFFCYLQSGNYYVYDLTIEYKGRTELFKFLHPLFLDSNDKIEILDHFFTWHDVHFIVWDFRDFEDYSNELLGENPSQSDKDRLKEIYDDHIKYVEALESFFEVEDLSVLLDEIQIAKKELI